MFSIRSNNSVLYVPISFLDDVAEENNFDFIEEEKLADGFENLADRKLRSIMTCLGDRGKKGHNKFNLSFGVVIEGQRVFGREVSLIGGKMFLFHNKKNYKNFFENYI